jgi:hypothetical protein
MTTPFEDTYTYMASKSQIVNHWIDCWNNFWQCRKIEEMNPGCFVCGGLTFNPFILEELEHLKQTLSENTRYRKRYKMAKMWNLKHLELERCHINPKKSGTSDNLLILCKSCHRNVPSLVCDSGSIMTNWCISESKHREKTRWSTVDIANWLCPQEELKKYIIEYWNGDYKQANFSARQHMCHPYKVFGRDLFISEESNYLALCYDARCWTETGKLKTQYDKDFGLG